METIKSYDQISGAYFDYKEKSQRTVKVSNTVSAMSIVGKDDVGQIASALTNIKFGSNVKKIDEYCCANAVNLTSVTPGAIKVIADHAFENCTKLSAFQPFVDGSAIYTVGNNAFANTQLQNVVLNLQNADDATYEYQGCVKTEKETGPYAGRYAFYNCKNLKTVSFRRSTELGAHMFDGCTSLTSVSIPNNLSGSCVGEYAFANCSNLSSITFPYRFEIFSKHMFDGCKKLSNIFLQNPPATDKTQYFYGIEDYAFNGCDSLTQLSIPEQVSSIQLFQKDCLAGSQIVSVFLKGMLSSEFDKFYRLSSITTTSTQVLSSQKGTYPIGTMLDSSQYGVYEEALKTNIPLVIWCCGDGCGRCSSFKQNVASTAAWQDFVKNSPYYFVYFNFSSQYSRELDNILWKKLKVKATSWQGKKDRSSLSYVAFFFVWKKLDGTLVCECPPYLNGSAGNFQAIKNYCKQYFAGFEYDDSLMVATSTKKTTKTETIVITEESFNAWGVNHACDFFTKDGMRFHFDPTAKLSATADGFYMQQIAGDAVTLTFSMLGSDGKYSNSMSCIVANNAEITQFAPNMLYLGACTKQDPSTTKVDTGRYNLCGKIYEYTYNYFTSWGAGGTIASMTKELKANYSHPSGRGGLKFVYYNNLGQVAQVKDAEKQGTTTLALDNLEYSVPDSLDDLSATYLMNDCLSTAMTNIYNNYKDADSGEEDDDGQQTAPEPQLYAWIKIKLKKKGGSAASDKLQIKVIRPGSSILSRCAKYESGSDFVQHYIPWYSNYDSTYNSKELIKVNAKGKVSILAANKNNAIANCIYFDNATKSYGIKLKGSTNTLIAYGCLGQYFPCTLHAAAGKVKANLTVAELMANRLAAYLG